MSVRLYPGAFAIAVLAAARGYRSGSLNRGGATAAALLGYSALANPLSVFGVCLLGFYLAGSRATKVRCRAACSALGLPAPGTDLQLYPPCRSRPQLKQPTKSRSLAQRRSIRHPELHRDPFESSRNPAATDQQPKSAATPCSEPRAPSPGDTCTRERLARGQAGQEKEGGASWQGEINAARKERAVS